MRETLILTFLDSAAFANSEASLYKQRLRTDHPLEGLDPEDSWENDSPGEMIS